MNWKIPRCYDSHTHLLYSGILQKGLRLFDLQSTADLRHIPLLPEYFRGDWLVGFGWDQHKFPAKKYPTRQDLDEVYPDFPVAFSRADGHAVWLNSKALEVIGYLGKTEAQRPAPAGGVILRDNNGHPTGIFIELAKIYVDGFIPGYSPEQMRFFLKEAIRYFNQRGFTHIRDMSGVQTQWELLRDLDLAGELTLYVDENFTCENIEDFERALAEAEAAKKEQTPHLLSRGVKFYFDGALGSEGAFLSKNYIGKESRGLTLWPLDHVEQVIVKTWQKDLEVSVHTIGDEAAHQVISVAHKVAKSGRANGILNVEHSQLMRPETIYLLKELRAVCHLQPCHWLTDRQWLRDKLGDLYPYAFPWQRLQENNIQIQWGSDSPIEEASVKNNYQALVESPEHGIGKFNGDLLAPHSHRDINWGDNCSTEFVDGKPAQVIFDGRKLSF